MNESEKKERADARKKRKRRQMFIGRMIIVILLFIILGLCAFLGKDMLEKKKLRDNREQAATSAESESTADTAGTESAAETETQAQKKEEQLRRFIIEELHSGATVYEAIGAYNLEKHNEIITIVDKSEYQKLMNFINREDPKAFITVYTVSDMRYQPKVWEKK